MTAGAPAIDPYACTYGETILRAEHVSLSYGETLVLRDVNLEVRDIVGRDVCRGQVIGFLGPSGVGKTTMSRVLSGLERPTAGRVLLGNGQPVRAGDVGFVLQNSFVFYHRTVWSNLLVAAAQRYPDRAERQARAEAMLEQCYLTDRRHAYPRDLSGGQRQRLAIARQLLSSEHLLVMDEPFSGLDLVMVQKVCHLIRQVADADNLNTFVIVTHNEVAAGLVADTLWLMGRDRDASGAIVPGARIQETYDLVARGLAWREDVHLTPEFGNLMREVRARFVSL